jgi:hypothetical protein
MEKRIVFLLPFFLVSCFSVPKPIIPATVTESAEAVEKGAEEIKDAAIEIVEDLEKIDAPEVAPIVEKAKVLVEKVIEHEKKIEVMKEEAEKVIIDNTVELNTITAKAEKYKTQRNYLAIILIAVFAIGVSLTLIRFGIFRRV